MTETRTSRTILENKKGEHVFPYLDMGAEAGDEVEEITPITRDCKGKPSPGTFHTHQSKGKVELPPFEPQNKVYTYHYDGNCPHSPVN